MHPSGTELRMWADGQSNPEARPRLERHLAVCELCQEYVDDWRAFRKAVEAAAGEPVPGRARDLAEGLFRDAGRPRLIRLVPLDVERPARRQLLAADGIRPDQPSVHSLATLYSDDPEVVLRVMRDRRSDCNYLQLISDDPQLAANVLVASLELDREYVTDSRGRADLGDLAADRVARAGWQIRLPDAVFQLEPVAYDRDRTEYTSEVILETEHDDRIRVVFEGKAEGKQLLIEVLHLEGRKQFGACIVSVSQLEQSSVMDIRPGQAVRYRLTDEESRISIRLFS